jgi:hypothetical protein
MCPYLRNVNHERAWMFGFLIRPRVAAGPEHGDASLKKAYAIP